MDQQRIEYLHDTYLQDTLSLQERREWENMLNDPGTEKVLQSLIYARWEDLGSDDKIMLNKNRSEEIFALITSIQQPIEKRIWHWPHIAAAAMLLISLSAGLFFLTQQKYHAQQLTQQIIRPGGYKAFLTLANGKKIDLNEAADGQLATQAGMRIRKTASGQLVYEMTGTPSGGTDLTGYNTIEVPAGGQWQAVLPDGSHIWLNSLSSIRFPASFARQERRVELKGEAYFEIAHNKAKPFRVESGKQTVEVLGTHFNVMAYADERTIKTTLLEGSVKILGNGDTRVLIPGEQAQFNQSGIKVSKEADLEYVVAWKNGYFNFNESLESIMNKLARWYDVDVEFTAGAPKNDHFLGYISKTNNLSAVLRQLERTDKVRFEINGRNIKILKP